jgi:hypothetical protein
MNSYDSKQQVVYRRKSFRFYPEKIKNRAESPKKSQQALFFSVLVF